MPTKEIAPGVLAVTELPKDAIKIVVFQSKELWYTFNDRECTDEDIIPLPPGSWSIVGWSDELTGGQIYELGLTVREFKESLRSHGIDRALIIKKEK